MLPLCSRNYLNICLVDTWLITFEPPAAIEVKDCLVSKSHIKMKVKKDLIWRVSQFTSYRKSHDYRYSVRKMKTEIIDWSGILCLSSCTISNMDVYSITRFIVLSKQSYEALSWQFCCKSVYRQQKTQLPRLVWPLMSSIEPKYCLISTSYLAGLFGIIVLHIWQNRVCFGDFLPMRTLCDAYHKEFECH